jgi:peptidyl-prolyl cis-trans isomerase A (cyclophilin A)
MVWFRRLLWGIPTAISFVVISGMAIPGGALSRTAALASSLSAIDQVASDRFDSNHFDSNHFDSSRSAIIEILTDLGPIILEIDTLRAPVTAANFLRYVEAGLYDGGSFFRTVHAQNQPTDSIRIEVIQGRIDGDRRDEALDAIPLERTSETGMKHLNGTISMARSGPDTATGSFFICIGDQPSLDFGGMRNPDGQGFAAFGRVISGMTTVLAIQKQPADGQSLKSPVEINSARRALRE